MTEKVSLATTFQRDLNRSLDTDRLTRKKGLEKLLKDLPWDDTKKSKRAELIEFLNSAVMKSLFVTLGDSVEKCRELSLSLLKKSLETIGTGFHYDSAYELIHKLCDRINEVPFLEPAEELRLQVVEVIQLVLKTQRSFIRSSTSGAATPLIEKVLHALTKALNDSFPKVKDVCAKLICTIAPDSPLAVRSVFKHILKGLAVNALHQHSKTRSISLQAIGAGMSTLGTEEYETLMKDTVLHLFTRLVADRTPNVRIELAIICSGILSQRIAYCASSRSTLVKMDMEVVALLLLMAGDEQEQVAAQASASLRDAVKGWSADILLAEDTSMGQFSDGGEVIDGEALMQSAASNEDEEDVPINAASRASSAEAFVQANIRELSTIMLLGVESWTVEAKRRALRGLEQFILLAESRIDSLLPRLLQTLGLQIRDDEADIRSATDQCCLRLGAQCDFGDILDILLPRVNGEVPGGDTYTQRTNALRTLTQTLRGFPDNSYVAMSDSHAQDDDAMVVSSSGLDPSKVALLVSRSLANTALYAFREAVTREAALLLARTVIQLFPEDCTANMFIQRNVVLSLVYLCGRCPGEDDVVRDFAQQELARLATLVLRNSSDTLSADKRVEQLLATHFDFMFSTVTGSSSQIVVTTSPNWDPHSPAKAAFDVLVGQCPLEAWRCHLAVVSVITLQVQPKTGPAANSAEANALSYAAQRGEELIALTTDVDVRLSLLALLEGYIRGGAADWECSPHMAVASEKVIKEVLLPNLIWRVGKVEATIRKVALATAYALLRAGGVTYETLFRVAPELVPLLVGNLDDQELTPRLITCLCLTVIFERLRGAFGEQSVREIYPKLLARLDDSADTVRIAICGTMTMFLQSAPPACYSGTTIDYTLDQLFIHLDDPDPAVQNAVFAVIVTAAGLDKALVLKKANANRANHRSPLLCDRLVVEVQGFEILED